MQRNFLEKPKETQASSPHYRVIRMSDGRLIRVDVQKARKAMKHAMILRAKERALRSYV